MAAYDERTSYSQAWHLLEAIRCDTSFDHQVQNLRDVLQDKISANDPFLQLELEANQIVMESALDFLKEAIAQTHRSLSRCTITGLTGDIMYSMLLNGIAQAQFSSTSMETHKNASQTKSIPELAVSQIQPGEVSENELVPDHYQWHNMNRTDDKMARDYLDSLQHQFTQAIKAANRLTSARTIIAKHSAIQCWTTAMIEKSSVPQKHRRAASIISVAYSLIRATPRGCNQHHVTLMGNDIQDITMASDDPMMTPNEHDLAFFNLSESIMVWSLNKRNCDAAQVHTKGDIDVVQLTARPSAINIKTELPAFITFTDEAVSLVTAADTLSDVSLIDE